MSAGTSLKDDFRPLLTAAEESDPRYCAPVYLPSEDIIKRHNCRQVKDNLGAHTTTDDIRTSPVKDKLLSKLDLWSTITPSRDKILELLRPEDPDKDALEAIMRAAPRRGLIRPYDEDTRRFLQKILVTPSSTDISQSETHEPSSRLPITEDRDGEPESKQKDDKHGLKKERSLADELREAEEDERSGAKMRRELLREFRKRGGGIRESMERDRLGKLALAVEDDEENEECGLSAAARRLDALLQESRSLHEELAGIREDMQVLARRVARQDH